MRRLLSLSAAMALLLAGFLSGLEAVVLTATSRNQPLISAAFKPDTNTLEGTVTIEALQSDGPLFVEIAGWPIRVGIQPPAPDRLFTAQVGASQEGGLTLPFAIFIPPRLYQEVQVAAWTKGAPTECRDDQGDARLGCLLVRMPVGPGERPDMHSSMKAKGRSGRPS